MISEGRDDERARMETVYRGYEAEGIRELRWSSDLPGNRCIQDERNRQMTALLADAGSPERVLEVGCGAGGVMSELAVALTGERPGPTIVGVDIVADRLVHAVGVGSGAAHADARNLPFADESFDVVVAFTVFSSIVDADIRRSVARDVTRVLRPGGHLVWYDMRLPGPNRSLRAMSRREIRRLFPHLEFAFRSLTVLPPLARQLGSFDRRAYPALAAVPLLRSHTIGLGLKGQ